MSHCSSSLRVIAGPLTAIFLPRRFAVRDDRHQVRSGCESLLALNSIVKSIYGSAASALSSVHTVETDLVPNQIEVHSLIVCFPQSVSRDPCTDFVRLGIKLRIVRVGTRGPTRQLTRESSSVADI